MKRYLSCLILTCFVFNTIIPPQVAQAQLQGVALPAVGTMVTKSNAFSPSIIKGITVHPENPLAFDFIVDTGDNRIQGKELRSEANKMIKYFLASLTVPEKDLWVNLSPYEKGRIIAEGFGKTEMGRDLLAQDYILKQLTASLIYPESDLGREFWSKVRAKVQAQYGTTDLPVNTFNKVWIVPNKAVVYEHSNSAFVVESHLKVMLEADYLSMQKNSVILSAAKDLKRDSSASPQNDTSSLGSQVIREILIPQIEEEVNQGKNFANLRQIYNSMILAVWFKKNLRESLLGQVYMDQNKVKGVDLADVQAKEKIYQQYLQSFKKGAYNYIKEEVDPATNQVVPRKYFSGGAVGLPAQTLETRTDFAQLSTLQRAAAPSDSAMKVSIVLGENPTDKAQAAAQADAAMLTQGPDETIGEFVQRMKRMQLVTQNIVSGTFNNVEMKFDLGDSPESVLKQYAIQLNRASPGAVPDVDKFVEEASIDSAMVVSPEDLINFRKDGKIKKYSSDSWQAVLADVFFWLGELGVDLSEETVDFSAEGVSIYNKSQSVLYDRRVYPEEGSIALFEKLASKYNVSEEMIRKKLTLLRQSTDVAMNSKQNQTVLDLSSVPIVNESNLPGWTQYLLAFYKSNSISEFRRLQRIIREGQLRAGPMSDSQFKGSVESGVYVVPSSPEVSSDEILLGLMSKGESQENLIKAYKDWKGALRSKAIEKLALYSAGSIATTIDTLNRYRIFQLFVNKLGVYQSVTLRQIKQHVQGLPKEVAYTTPNDQYILGVLRALDSMGWLTRQGRSASEDMSFTLTEKGKQALKLVDKYQLVSQFMPESIRLGDFLMGRPNAPRISNRARTLSELAALSQRDWDIPADVTDKELIEEFEGHMDGYLISNLLMAMNEEKIFRRVDGDLKLDIKSLGGDKDRLRAAFDLMAKAGFVTRFGDEVELTNEGVIAFDRTLANGVPVSYDPSYKLVEQLLFGNVNRIPRERADGSEALVDRLRNVEGSGFAHDTYFKQVDRIVADAVNYKIDTGRIPSPDQLSKDRPFVFAWADTGSGDGAFLEHIYHVVLEKTKFGALLKEYPDLYRLEMVGVDYNKVSQDATQRRLANANIPHTILFGDINDPKTIVTNVDAKLVAKYGEGIKKSVIHTRTFLDHNRPWKAIEDRDMLKKRVSSSTGAFGWRGLALSNEEVEQNLYEHFKAWAEALRASGQSDLLVLELHTIKPEVASKNLRRSLDIAYQLSHLLSDQFIIEEPIYVARVEEAGFRKHPNGSYHNTWPPKAPELTTVSLHYFTLEDPADFKPATGEVRQQRTSDAAQKSTYTYTELDPNSKEELRVTLEFDPSTNTTETIVRRPNGEIKSRSSQMGNTISAAQDKTAEYLTYTYIDGIDTVTLNYDRNSRATEFIVRDEKGDIKRRYPYRGNAIPFVQSQRDAIFKDDAHYMSLVSKIRALINKDPEDALKQVFDYIDGELDNSNVMPEAINAFQNIVARLGRDRLAQIITEMAVKADKENSKYEIQETPLVEASTVGSVVGKNVFIKAEYLQATKSFKPRYWPYVVRQMELSKDRHGGVDVVTELISGSTGNHGAGLAFLAQSMGKTSITFISDKVSDVKRQDILRRGGTYKDKWLDGRPIKDYEEARSASAEYLKTRGDATIMVPHSSPTVGAGYGTVMVEIARQLAPVIKKDSPTLITVPVGEGGLAVSIAIVAQAIGLKNVKVVGVGTDNYQSLELSLKAGRIIRTQGEGQGQEGIDAYNLEDGIAVPEVAPFSLAIAQIYQDVFKLVHVSRQDVAVGMNLAYQDTSRSSPDNTIEGATGAATIALLTHPEIIKDVDNVVIVSTGRRVAKEVWSTVYNPNFDANKEAEAIKKRFVGAVGAKADAAMTPLGGINLDPTLMNLQIKRDGKGVPLPLSQQPISDMKIDGFMPIIIKIAPVENLQLLLGFALPVKGSQKTADSGIKTPTSVAREPEQLALVK